MEKPTPKQVAAEIAALKKLKPVGVFARKTMASIQIAIDALNDTIDETSDEFNVELTDAERDITFTAIAWKNGESASNHPVGWGSLVAP